MQKLLTNFLKRSTSNPNLALILRNHIHKSKYFSTKRNHNKEIYDIDFPFNLDGLNKQIDINRSAQFGETLKGIFDENIFEGYKLAYRNCLEALEQYDLEYYEGICEPRLYSRIKDSLQELQNDQYKIKVNNIEMDDITTYINKINIIYGVKVNRNENLSLSEYQKQEINFMSLKLIFYGPTSANPMILQELLPFLQVEVYYSSPAKIVLYDKNGNKINTGASTNLHKMIFENESEPDGQSMMNLLQKSRKMSSLFSMMMGSQESKQQLIKEFFVGKNFTWKITDIDSYLKGNPHAM